MTHAASASPAQPSGRRRWRVRGWRRWTLRARLAVVTAALAALALLAVNGAGLLLLEAYLVDRVDQQLANTGNSPALDRARIAELKEGPLGDDGSVESILSQRAGATTRIYAVAADGSVEQFPDEAASPGPRLPGRAELAARAGGAPFTVPAQEGDADWRVAVGPEGTDANGEADADDELIVTAASLATVQATYERLLLIDLGVTAGVLALLAVAAALVVRVGLRPLTRMAVTAGAIAAGDFSRRVDDADAHTEPGRLGRAMNAMLARVESEIAARMTSEQRLRRFLADASHELRTPLTSMRGFAELYRRGGDPADAMRRIEAEAQRMGVLVEDLLLLARLDEQRGLERRPVDLLELCADLLRDLHARSPGRRVYLAGLDDTALPEPAVVSGDPLRLRQVVGNLLANADRHTPPDAEITVRVGRTAAPARHPAGGDTEAAAGWSRRVGEGVVAVAGSGPAAGTAAVVEVADTGAGVPAGDAPYVFERLYRAGPARPRGGSGLGLAIAAGLAQSHGGRIELADRPPGEGAVFRLLLPVE
ncbi:HAMP domain-containing sensor histidine kinase [Streptomyces sp. WMMC500]|uniref:sensor histidine kinase n=1 Tax=Streptomyces sp. WMMC500 TaxID=3015154 RepID=UPI00248B2D3C|nr:HAMP domain-containing sensor histidine kinase [Streptomyces sp. WMMC500]WBB62546.1 HAMP domain-containing sensor histidine kinase [Streptomyces sp. WMMC500]